MGTINRSVLTRFVAVLISSLIITGSIHVAVLIKMNLPAFDNLLVLAYVGNGLLAVIISTVVYRLRFKQKSNLGFFFMAGSMLKFAMFFILFNGSYKIDGDISKLEFLTFFIPYSAALIVETSFLIRLLNRID